MATSGTTTFELDVSDTIEEAYERIGLEVRSGYQAKTARRSLNLLLQSLSNKQINLWKLTLTSQTLTQGTASYTLAADIIDIDSVVLRRDSIDTQMHRLSRFEYQSRPDKTSQGRPSQFWLDRQTTPILYVYPAPENSTDAVRFYAMERIEDISTSQNTIDVPSRFSEAITAGLAYRLALKFKPEMVPLVKAIYDEELIAALDEDRERVPFKVRPKIARI